MATRRREVHRLLDVVAGTQPTLAKIAQGYGRVATTAHPMCTCTSSWSSCPQHVGVRAGSRYVQTVVPPEEVAA